MTKNNVVQLYSVKIVYTICAYPYCGNAQPRTTNKIPIAPVNDSNKILK